MLYPNLGFYYGVQVLQVQEGTGAGCQFSNLFTRTLPDDPITMGVIWILFLANVVIFGFLTWYMDSIKPGPFGVAKKWYFIFQVCSILLSVYQSYLRILKSYFDPFLTRGCINAIAEFKREPRPSLLRSYARCKGQ